MKLPLGRNLGSLLRAGYVGGVSAPGASTSARGLLFPVLGEEEIVKKLKSQDFVPLKNKDKEDD